MNDDAGYLETAHPLPHPILMELEQRSRKDGVPILARETGRLLSTVVAAMQASRILEVGTAYGYATLWMAFAQPRMGKIWTIEQDARRTDVARKYFRQADEDDDIEIFNTPPLELLENFPHRNLDLVFIDARTTEYRAYLDLVIPMLKLSGLVIVDDCLLGGRVSRARAGDDAVDRMRAFNAYFLTHPQLDATILPVGSGTGIGARRQ
ncbi:MAG: O-methyltransferase [Candidatus Eremiobacteraeota bacterium]|nr:O-methyltransferase [Candidatus Eremiobacteraeota bacterium]